MASDIVERLMACPDIGNARIVAPADRVPEVVVPTSLRDAIRARIESQDAALRKAREDLVKIAKIVGSNRTVGARLARIDALARASLSTLNELLGEG